MPRRGNNSSAIKMLMSIDGCTDTEVVTSLSTLIVVDS